MHAEAVAEAKTAAYEDLSSVLDLAQTLIRTPSCSDHDAYEPVLKILEEWLTERGLDSRRLHDAHGALVGMTCILDTGRAGPMWVLDACADTAPIGDETTWSFPPLAGDIVDGWLRGRGAADSKTGAAIFCHIAQRLARPITTGPHHLVGSLALLFDVDEHSGGFGGARAFFAGPGRQAAGVMIGYPGSDHVVVGGRGVFRVKLKVRGVAAHSGASRPTACNALVKAAALIAALDAAPLPSDPGQGFRAAPKLTVTSVNGGSGFTVVPDTCEIAVDVRLTPTLDAAGAARLIQDTVMSIDARHPSPEPTAIEEVTMWPPYRLTGTQQPAAALLQAAHAVGARPVTKVAGPSNIGNYLSGLGIPATAGFGPDYEGLHGADERVVVASIPAAQASYHLAVQRLLTQDDDYM
ncbi:M20/M25/M40 family metallo-hydrolase [Solwaraspora sp. WMMD1047]|uniref:M20/M25/M40 family metallo-hydrolase n=1 Tax=Solwaraspora sp. WMMD1047 TaxID=3016102 RepID=UPI002415B49E|nr:M20/M25/M40 family metallo-hydrolase [Solwaraspora sp. WMMD1047]MDG4834876.1 M20/M25/M40 family metallo-hydrolase [Solwaraspora sp. WMMD1047]MDG4834893.1 M20/M25/M40 family metallo-hydrolase [Solwaraspora sp. WMMD1047]